MSGPQLSLKEKSRGILKSIGLLPMLRALRSNISKSKRRSIKRLGLSKYFFPRDRLAHQYLSGKGLEIGALNEPTGLPAEAKVEYFDLFTREELFRVRDFPDLNMLDMVVVNHVGNGFTLDGIPSDGLDFLIAHHVLEHSSNPIGAMEHWFRVLKKSGRLLCSVPIAERCFDRGRPVTSYQHLLEDYHLSKGGDFAAMKERNSHHYREWVTISEVNNAESEIPLIAGESVEERMKKLADKNEGIHFHSFSRESFSELFSRLSKDVFPGLKILEVVDWGIEVVVVVQKG